MQKARELLKIQEADLVMEKIKYLIEDIEIQVDGYIKFWDENSGKTARSTNNYTVKHESSASLTIKEESQVITGERLPIYNQSGLKPRKTLHELLDFSSLCISDVDYENEESRKFPREEIKVSEEIKEEERKKCLEVPACDPT